MDESRLHNLEQALAAASGPGRIDALNDLAEALDGVDAQRMLRLASEAEELAAPGGGEAGKARSLLNRGVALSILGRLEEGVAALGTARDLAESGQQDDLLSRSLLHLGTALARLGRSAEARDALQAAHTLFCALGDPLGEADCLNELGVLADLAGDYAEAFERYRAALSLQQGTGEAPRMAGALGNLGHVWSAMGDHERALAYHQQALDLFERRAEPHNVARALLNVALANADLGRPEVALDLYGRALPSLRRQGDEVAAALVQANLSFVQVELGAAPLAVPLAEEALATLERLGAAPLTVVALLGLGKAQAALGHLDAARASLERAVECGQAYGPLEVTLQAHEALSSVLLRLGDGEAAHDHLRECLDLERELTRRQAAQRTRALLVELEADTARREAEAARGRAQELQHLNEVLAAAHVENLHLLQRLEQQANQDVLTGLYNRRYFNRQFEQELRRAVEHGLPLTVALLDVDHFKRVNDTFSHLTGDRVLARVAQVLAAHCGGTDTLARYGGEEFVLLMPHTGIEDAERRCARMLRAVEQLRWEELPPHERVTLSAGLADLSAVDAAGGPLGQADRKLYQAKQAGRNRVCR